MQRHVLSLNEIPYLVEHYNASEFNIKSVKNFVMLRKYGVMNEVAYDKELYFIDIDTYKNIISKNVSEETNKVSYSENNDVVVFPHIVDYYESLSTTILDFLPDSTYKTLYYNNDNNIDSDIYKDYYRLLAKNHENQFELLNVECDVIRIYKPHNRKNIDFVIHISNIINDIHFHYFCQKYNKQELSVGKEIQYKNNIYYEYIEIYIPSMESLFGKQTYYNEDLNFYKKQAFEKFTINVPTYNDNNDVNIYRSSDVNESKKPLFYTTAKANKLKITSELLNNEEGAYNKALLHNLIMPYMIEKGCNSTLEDCSLCDYAIDCQFKELKDVYFKTFIVNDINDEIYQNSDYNYHNSPIVVTFSHYDTVDEASHSLLSLDGISPSSIILNVDNRFLLSATLKFDETNHSIMSLVSRWNYPQVKKSNGELMTLQEAYYYFNKIDDKDLYDEMVDDDDYDLFLENFSEEVIESFKFSNVGYMIEFSLDTGFTKVFYRNSVGATDEDSNECIDDFTFNLDNIFMSWKEYPDMIFTRAVFIDKRLSRVWTSNIVPITKEKFKYLINETESNYRINLKDMKNFAFIDKINCVINCHDVLNENQFVIGGNSTNQTIVYKTVFYRTHDSQTIQLRAGVTQTVGINLSEYMTKVPTFKMKLQSYEFTESGRNDAYILFTIPVAQLGMSAGKYDIVNADDDTYITSGNYSIV